MTNLTRQTARPAPVTWKRLTTVSWMLGCALLAAGDILRVATGNDSATTPVAWGWGIQALGAMLAITGLPGVYHHHVARTGVLGTVGLAGITVFLFLFGVFGGLLHAVAVPELIKEGISKPPGVSQTFFIGVICALLGCLTLGIATLRARVRQGVAAPLFAGGAALLIGHPIGKHIEDLGLLLLLAGLVWASMPEQPQTH